MIPFIASLGKDINAVVVITDSGAIMSGKCNACNVSGLLTPRYGIPWPAPRKAKDVLWHKSYCPVNDYLQPDGNVKEPEEERTYAV